MKVVNKMKSRLRCVLHSAIMHREIGKMKRYEKTIATILIAVTLVVGSISILPEKWNVTENKSVTHMSTEYAGCTYKYGANNNKIEQEMIDENDYSKKNNYTIMMREKGKKKVLIEGVERGVITNGKYLYYTKYENRKFYMYCMKLSTQKSKKIFCSTKQYEPYDKHGHYLYYSLPVWQTEDRGSTVYVYDLKTKKRRHLADGIGRFVNDSKRIFLLGITGDESEVPIYCSKMDGSYKKRIGKGIDCFIYRNHIYWVKMKYIGSEKYYRLKGCDMNYKNKKYFTKWINAEKFQDAPYSNNGFKKYFKKHYLKK